MGWLSVRLFKQCKRAKENHWLQSGTAAHVHRSINQTYDPEYPLLIKPLMMSVNEPSEMLWITWYRLIQSWCHMTGCLCLAICLRLRNCHNTKAISSGSALTFRTSSVDFLSWICISSITPWTIDVSVADSCKVRMELSDCEYTLLYFFISWRRQLCHSRPDRLLRASPFKPDLSMLVVVPDCATALAVQTIDIHRFSFRYLFYP